MNEIDVEDHRRMLADSAQQYMERGYGDAVRRASLAQSDGCDSARWKEFAELGWLALPLPEQDGGLGGSMADVCLIAEAMGRGLVSEPYVASGVMAAMLLSEAAPLEVRERWLQGAADGSLRLAFGGWEPGAAFDVRCVRTTMQRVGGGLCLTGRKAMVLGGAGADAFLIAARADDGSAASLCLVDAATPGLTVTPGVLHDGQHIASLELDGVVPTCLLLNAPLEDVLATLQRAVARGTVAHCAETVGVMQRSFEITLDYLKTRRQFGSTIASNQVVQHRLVDLHVEISEARAATLAAARACDAPRHASRDAGPYEARHVAAAKACVSRVARHVWEESVQLHGAIGMTQECAVAPFVKRLAVAASLYGSTEFHLDRLAALSLDARTSPAFP